ncbi:unnamed protein product, partial [Didymodactylos carnosus]
YLNEQHLSKMAFSSSNHHFSTQVKPTHLRQRRTISVQILSSIDDERYRNYYRYDVPIHSCRDSLFSSNRWPSTDYHGFLNLCIVLLVMSSGRLVLENLIKYGLLIDGLSLFHSLFAEPHKWPGLSLGLCVNIFVLIAYQLELILSRLTVKSRFEKYLYVLHVINLIQMLIVPAICVWYFKPNPLSSFIALMIYTIVFMKLISYIHINYICREALPNLKLLLKRHRSHHDLTSLVTNGHYDTSTTTEEDEEEEDNEMSDQILCETSFRHQSPLSKMTKKKKLIKGNHLKSTKYLSLYNLNESLVDFYPLNLTLSNLYYFLVIPTLCYELKFPKTRRIRKRFLIRRTLEVIFFAMLNILLIQQWIMPILRNSHQPFRDLDYLRLIERLLKLAVPNNIVWLIFFYWYFHSVLNLIGELTYFGDREFYRDWWNASQVGVFWKNWNVPVHNFASRHLFKPLLRMGVAKFHSACIVFFISAFFHEYLVSVPLGMFRLWAFSGMILQLPFAFAVNHYLKDKPRLGNIAVWLSLIIGQPIAIMMYLHDYYYDYYRNTIQN